jgi:hypothetical protein
MQYIELLSKAEEKTGKLFMRRVTPLNRVREWLRAREREPMHL